MTQPEIQQEIEQTREQLGKTVEELVAKADIRATARNKAAKVKARAQDQVAELTGRARRNQVVQLRWPLAVTAAGLALAAYAAIWRRRET
jgi:succinyl-CoA synthetase beta subunit